MSKYDYNQPPHVVGREHYTNSALHFILAWTGAKRAPRSPDGTRLGTWRYHLNDGTQFQEHPVSEKITDWSAILYGCTDVTGRYWQDIIKTKRPCWNWLELDGPLTARDGHPALHRISQYRQSGAPLRDDQVPPEEWPEPYRSVWLAAA